METEAPLRRTTWRSGSVPASAARHVAHSPHPPVGAEQGGREAERRRQPAVARGAQEEVGVHRIGAARPATRPLRPPGRSRRRRAPRAGRSLAHRPIAGVSPNRACTAATICAVSAATSSRPSTTTQCPGPPPPGPGTPRAPAREGRAQPLHPVGRRRPAASRAAATSTGTSTRTERSASARRSPTRSRRQRGGLEAAP